MTIKTTIIAAMAQNRCIGKNNTIPWHIPQDFQHFKKTTMGKPMIMGRKTFESLPGILPGRPHIIVSRSGFQHDIIPVLKSFESAKNMALEIANENNHDEIFVIGGAQIYKHALDHHFVDRLVLSEVKMSVDGDAFFPEFDVSIWKETSRENIRDKTDFDIVIYDKQEG